MTFNVNYDELKLKVTRRLSYILDQTIRLL